MLRCIIAHMNLELTQDIKLGRAQHKLHLSPRSRGIHTRYRQSVQGRVGKYHRKRRPPYVVVRLHGGHRSRRSKYFARGTQNYLLEANMMYKNKLDTKCKKIWPAI